MNRYIDKIFGKWLLPALFMVLAVGCAQEFDEWDNGVKIEFTTPHLQDLQVETRAVSGYSGTISGSSSMGVFVRGIVNESTITYNGSSWESSLKLDPATYNIYSYIPKRSGVSFNATGSYPVITFTDVPFITDQEILISSGAVAETVTSDGGVFTPNDITGSLSKNSYSIEVESKENSRNYVTFMMDRVMAKVILNFKVNSKYDAIRTVKIKKVTLQPTSIVDIACTLTDKEITYQGSSTQSATLSPLVYNHSGFEVETDADDANPFATFYSVPGVESTVKMTVVYDVYDKSGTLIRADQEVTNASIKLIESGTLQRAEEYKLNINIVPTYLYSLSDTDKESVMFIQ